VAVRVKLREAPQPHIVVAYHGDDGGRDKEGVLQVIVRLPGMAIKSKYNNTTKLGKGVIQVTARHPTYTQ
jgi:hypothetical protein